MKQQVEPAAQAPEVQVFETVEAAQEAAAHIIAEALRPTATGEMYSIALSGGSTPRGMHEHLAALPGIDWSRVQVFWGDERTVPPDDDQSNYRMAEESLLSRVEVDDSHIHRMRGEIDPSKAADEYESELRQVFGDLPAGEFPALDVSVLGIGSDGHTASLFPGTEALDERERWVVANFVPQQDTWRITLTYPVLNAARLTVFLATGAEKVDALYRIFSPTVTDRPPSWYVQPTDGRVIFILDSASAEGVNQALAEVNASDE